MTTTTQGASELAVQAENLHSRTEEAAASIGRLPPAPPTIRGSLGAAVLRVVQPFFSWYSHTVREYISRAQSRETLILRTLRSLARESGELRSQIQEYRQEQRQIHSQLSDQFSRLEGSQSRQAEELLAKVRAEWKETAGALKADLEVLREQAEETRRLVAGRRDLTEQVTAVESAQIQLQHKLETLVQSASADSARASVLRQDVLGLTEEIDRLRSSMDEQVRTRLEEFETAVHEKAEEVRNATVDFDRNLQSRVAEAATRPAGQPETTPSIVAELKQRLEQQEQRFLDLSGSVHASRQQIMAGDARMTMLLRELRRTSTDAAVIPDSLRGSGFEMMYAAFEDLFRGTREEIKNRQRVYLSVLTEAGAGTSDRPVLDLGCGRGEWLELLREQGMTARGVDGNTEMVERSRASGLEVAQADAIAYLRDLPDSSLGAVTTFHMVEHLPFDDVLILISESLRVLKPGGVLLFETPNPNNLFVGARNFYTDPTHLHPLPCSLMRFVTEARGFSDVIVREVNPMPDSMRLPDTTPAGVFLNEHFFGPQDYAIIGRKY